MKKLIHKKYYVPNYVKSNLASLSNALYNELQYISKVLYKDQFSNIEKAKDTFDIRMKEFKKIMCNFQLYPSFYSLLYKYCELTTKAINNTTKRFFILLREIKTHLNVILNQLVYIS